MSAADPGLFALKNALRAAIVVPLAFALALEVVHDKQMALFASFGSVGLLVFVDFAGARRARLRAYLLLVLAGCALISLGTLCSRSPLLATIAMALVGFAILFAGVLDSYIAAAGSAALLTFVLAVMVPASPGAIPIRLAGWGLAAALAIPAALLLWPQRPRGALRKQAASVARTLAMLVAAQQDGAAQRERMSDERRAARDQVRALRNQFVATPARPGGTPRRVAALGRLVDDLAWLCAIADRPRGGGSRQIPLTAARTEVELAVPRALDAIAARLQQGEEKGSGRKTRDVVIALGRTDRAHAAVDEALIADLDDAGAPAEEAQVTRELDEAYRLRELAFATQQTGRDALLACGDRAEGDPLGSRLARVDATGQLARAHASARSVWLRNSVRGAVGLTLAVLVGQLSDLQHSFWIVLGTLSVLRSNALATGATVALALLGTLVGIVAGGLLLVAVGTNQAALWAVLPFAVLLAAYAPRAISFAAGQAAFSFVVLVLFNLIAPAGWKVGLVRVEDVAVGGAVSLLAGALIWPRGASAILREAFGAAYARAARYLEVTIDALLGGAGRESAEQAGREALAAAELLDATVRAYLAERGSARTGLDDLSVLVGGVNRARRVARLLWSAPGCARLAPVDRQLPRLARASAAFDRERRACCQWYAALGATIGQAREPPAPEPSAADGEQSPAGRVVLEAEPGLDGAPRGLAIAWAHRHVATLRAFEPALARAGTGVLHPLTARSSASGDPRARA